MKFTTVILFLLPALASATCLEGMDLNLVRGQCSWSSVVSAISRGVRSRRRTTCRGVRWANELRELTGERTFRNMRVKINEMCGATPEINGNGLNNFDVIDAQLNKEFMDEFVKGGTILNEGYGNFQTPENPSDSCSNALGDAVSVTIGKNVNEFREKAETVQLRPPVDWISQCQNNAVMCCWPRDRQCGDNNGSCNENGCADSDPADNTNLCYMDKNERFEKLEHVGTTKASIDIFPGTSEGDMHCHGFAWADNLNDPSARFIGNNFYYVSLYDHMYTRGYVNAIPGQNMCDCVENMASFSRSDCTEMTVSENSGFSIVDGQMTRTAGQFKIAFNACNGIPKNNDLYSYANKLRITNKLSSGKFENIKSKLFGLGGGNEEENACYTRAIAQGMAE